MTTPEPAQRVTYRSVAMPTEHGGWGFTLEPVLLGLLVAPSPAALGLGVAAFGVFLARRPLRLALTDRRLARRLPRTDLAVRAATGYLVAALAGVALAIVLAEHAFWVPLALAAPLAAIQVAADASRRSRELIPELAGASAVAAVAASIALADGWAADQAYGLWLVLAARIGGSVVLVRAQVRRARGGDAAAAPVLAVQAAAVAAVAAGVVAGIVPWTALTAIVILAGWAPAVLSRPPVPARTVGWTQMAAGLIVVLLTSAGHGVGG